MRKPIVHFVRLRVVPRLFRRLLFWRLVAHYSTGLAAAWNMDCCHRRQALAGRMSLSHRGSIHTTVFLSRSEHWLLVEGSNPHPLFPIGLFLFARSAMVISFVPSISWCFAWSLSTSTFDVLYLAVWCPTFSMVNLAIKGVCCCKRWQGWQKLTFLKPRHLLFSEFFPNYQQEDQDNKVLISMANKPYCNLSNTKDVLFFVVLWLTGDPV